MKFKKRYISLGFGSSLTRQVIHFADNSTTYEADLVIGADGINSTTRNAVVSDVRLYFSNTCACRGLIPLDTQIGWNQTQPGPEKKNDATK